MIEWIGYSIGFGILRIGASLNSDFEVFNTFVSWLTNSLCPLSEVDPVDSAFFVFLFEETQMVVF
jgi:hypothetical protein